MKNLKKTLIFGTLIAIAGFWSYNTFALPKGEFTYLDNEYIHSFQNRDGLWIIPSKSRKSPEAIIEEFGSNMEEFLELNNLQAGKKISRNNPLFFPYSETILQELEKEGKSREAVLSEPDKMVWPVILDKYSRITSRIGRRWNKFHTGIDIACRRGSIIVAAADGEVEVSGWMGHYGKVVQIYHPQVSHTETIYAHNTHLLVNKGDKVKKGQIIAFSGTTGKSTGPHLHFEVRYQNIFLNPEHFLPEFPDTVNTVAKLD
jgi:murein DD-endopeptidase MepM/ murein hydrolase activator NlpD